MTNEFKMFDYTKPKPKPESQRKIRYGKARKLRDIEAMKMPVRDDKVEEIKAVWQSPKFKSHNQRLIYLLRHCTIIEPQYGYTIREFLHAIYPQKMDPESTGEYDHEFYAFKAIRQMFRRFNHDVRNHEVVLSAVLAKGTGKWYYYNIIDDEQAMKDAHLRIARMCLGIKRVQQELQDIAEHSEDVEKAHKAHLEEIMTRVGERNEEDESESKSKTNPLKFKRERDEGQKTLDLG